MTRARREAPDVEWVLLYRNGIPTAQIAAEAGVSASNVRYHLQIAARTDPGIRSDHKTARAPASKGSSAGRRNLNDVVALFQAEGRLPTAGGRTPHERALGVWLLRRRHDAADGRLSRIYREGLSVIPNWESFASLQARHDARWEQRMLELVAYRAGRPWPRQKNPDTKEERVLGVWLHVQRISHRAGKLNLDREFQLNSLLPGWREGRAHSGGRHAKG